MKNYIKRCIAIILSLITIAACKKDNGQGNSNQQQTPPVPTTGQAIIYLKQDCNVGNVTVTINNVNRLIKNYAPNTPDCGADSSYAIFGLKPGDYPVSAAAGNLIWNGNITVVAGQCAGLQLTCDGVTPILMGAAGTPRFNLQHSAGVDFDLHVVTPDGSEINSYVTSGQGGTLDLQSSCLGSDTKPLSGLTATNENIYFPSGYAPHGTYKFWVIFSGTCGPLLSGTYSIRVMDGLNTLTTYTGTLTSTTVKSTVYTFVY